MSKDDYLSFGTIKRLYGQNRRIVGGKSYCRGKVLFDIAPSCIMRGREKRGNVP